VRVVFRALHDDPLLVDDAVLERHARAAGVASPRELRASRRGDELARTHLGRPEWLRAVADHVASLTDREALDLAAALA
jgi:dGTP triphosphohydrolase